MDTFTANIEDVRNAGLRERALAYLELTKPRIAVLLVLTSAAGFYLASNDGFNSLLFLHSMAAITLLAFGVSTLNQYIERDIDPLMARTAERPLPTRRVTAAEALAFGVVQCVVAELYLLFMIWSYFAKGKPMPVRSSNVFIMRDRHPKRKRSISRRVTIPVRRLRLRSW